MVFKLRGFAQQPVGMATATLLVLGLALRERVLCTRNMGAIEISFALFASQATTREMKVGVGPMKGPAILRLVLCCGSHTNHLTPYPVVLTCGFFLAGACLVPPPPLGARDRTSEWQNPLRCGHQRGAAGLRQRIVLAGGARGGRKRSRATPGKQAGRLWFVSCLKSGR